MLRHELLNLNDLRHPVAELARKIDGKCRARRTAIPHSKNISCACRGPRAASTAQKAR